MRRANLARSRIKEFEKLIDSCEYYKEDFIDQLQNIKDKLLDREIDYSEYEKIFNKKHDGKTLSEWIEYYDNYAEECRKRVENEKRVLFKSHVLLIFSFFFL